MEADRIAIARRSDLRQPPATRYQGSKRKLLPAIWQRLGGLPFTTALDAFGGTGSVAYLLKAQGKAVTYNDVLHSNHVVGTALVENPGTQLGLKQMALVLRRDPSYDYDDFIARTFEDVYFTSEENEWLDTVSQNIPRLADRYERAIAYYALFQAAIVKRPYNLFHRKNLYMRAANVRRSFGNKVTWDTPFAEHFRRFVAAANDAVFDSGVPCKAVCGDAADVLGNFDLVYADPPYVNGRGVGVDYFDFYHFLEGLLDYHGWDARIDRSRKHLPLERQRFGWTDPRGIHEAFGRFFKAYADAVLVVSYRSDGIPSPRELQELLRAVKSDVRIHRLEGYQYALSTNKKSEELLLVGV